MIRQKRPQLALAVPDMIQDIARVKKLALHVVATVTFTETLKLCARLVAGPARSQHGKPILTSPSTFEAGIISCFKNLPKC